MWQNHGKPRTTKPLFFTYAKTQNGRKATGNIVAAKLYPAGATTNSDSGVTNTKNIYQPSRKRETQAMVMGHRPFEEGQRRLGGVVRQRVEVDTDIGL